MRSRLFVLFALLALLVVACGADTDPATTGGEAGDAVVIATQAPDIDEDTIEEVAEAPTEEPADMSDEDTMVDPIGFSGDIAVAGSSTVFPLSERMKERFEDDGFGGQITVDSIGSGGGFERFCVEGESDISNASRPIKASEIEQCAEIGRNPIELRVGTDALAVVVSSANDFVDDVTMEELAMIYSTAETWADIRSEWPDEPIQRFSPGTDSGTFDYFVEEVFDEDEEPILASDNLELSENDNVLVQGVDGSPYAIAYFGYAYFQENADLLKPLAIDGVEPNQESVDAATYPLARPLYMYTDAGIMDEKPQVKAFVQYFLEHVNEEIGDVGYFPASDADLQGAMDAIMHGGSMNDGEMMEEGVMLPAVDPIEFSGDVAVAGSSTVFPLSERMKERFEDDGFGGQITVDSIGSGGGFERFCVEGESDISNASRPIKDSEIEQCAEIGRTPIEFRVGTDALAVVVSASNDFVDDVTMEELAMIYSTAETWADVRSEWPDEPIQRFSPGTDSGTFDYFIEEVFDEDEEPILASDNLELSENDNVLVQGVDGSPYAIAYFGYAYYQENADLLKPLAIDGVEPSQESVDAAEYPLARPLYIYSDAGIIADNPQVGAFINYFLTNVNEEIVDVGYFPAGQADLDDAIQKLADALQ